VAGRVVPTRPSGLFVFLEEAIVIACGVRVRAEAVKVFSWLLAPASILAALSLVVFVLADFERMKTLRAVATGALVLACLVTLGAGLFALYERRRR
jgi:succinate dehydrogenase hydrophobic anchor subunit